MKQSTLIIIILLIVGIAAGAIVGSSLIWQKTEQEYGHLFLKSSTNQEAYSQEYTYDQPMNQTYIEMIEKIDNSDCIDELSFTAGNYWSMIIKGHNDTENIENTYEYCIEQGHIK